MGVGSLFVFLILLFSTTMMRGGKTGRGGRTAGGQEPRSKPDGPTRADSEVEDGATGGVTGTEDDEGRELTIADRLVSLEAHMGQQQAWEARLNQEAARQDQRLKTHATRCWIPWWCEGPELDFSHPEDIQSGQSRYTQEPRLEKLTESDNVEHFLITCEHIAVACRWSKSDWTLINGILPHIANAVKPTNQGWAQKGFIDIVSVLLELDRCFFSLKQTKTKEL